MTTEELFRYLVAAGSAAPSADNMQPWQFELLGELLILRYKPAGGQLALFGPEHPATLMTMGAVMENLVQACAALGLPDDIGRPADCSPSGSSSDTLFQVRLTSLPMMTPPHLPLFQRHTNRLPFRKSTLPSSVRDEVRAQTEGGAAICWIEAPQAIARISRLVRQASEIRFQTREIHEWFARSLRFTRQQVDAGDGLDVGTFDLPPGGRLLLRTITASWANMSLFNRIGGYRFLAAVEATSLKKAGAVIAVVGPKSRQGAIDAGRLMQRAWIGLNAAGYGVQPYYVVADQINRLDAGSVPAKLEAKVRELVQQAAMTVEHEASDMVHLLLRVGEPIRPAKRAMRLPLASVVRRA